MPTARSGSLIRVMTDSVLVTYGTTHGSTGEVAAAIAETLREHGLDVDLTPAADVVDVAAYDGVVIGGALYFGRLHPEVRKLLTRSRRALAQLPVAVFAMGPSTLKPKDVEGSRDQLNHWLAKVPEVTPFAIAIFGGVLDPTQVSFPFNRMPASDARDWDDIRDWADEIAGVLAPTDALIAV